MISIPLISWVSLLLWEAMLVAIAWIYHDLHGIRSVRIHILLLIAAIMGIHVSWHHPVLGILIAITAFFVTAIYQEELIERRRP